MSNHHMVEDAEGTAGASPDAELTTVVFARNQDRAARYRAMLEEVGIPAMVADQAESGPGRIGGMSISVPGCFREQASEIIASFYAGDVPDEDDPLDDEDDPEDDDDDDDDDDLFPDDDDDDFDDDLLGDDADD